MYSPRQERAEELKTEEELKQLAADILGGRIFTSGMIPDARDIPLVFTPCMLMDKQAREELDAVKNFIGDPKQKIPRQPHEDKQPSLAPPSHTPLIHSLQ